MGRVQLAQTKPREARCATETEQAAQEGSASLLIRGLSVYYTETCALKEVDMEVSDRSITAFIGPSGCGKSTLLRCLNRMNDTIAGARVEGEVRVSGINIYDPHVDVTAVRRMVGMVFQRPNPFAMSIYDNVAYGPRLVGATKAEVQGAVEKSLERAALWDEVKDRLKESALALSGGQQQRLCIARALAVEPRILLLDEPCSALDPVSTMRIEDLLVELKEGLTIVMVTHNMQQAARVADEVGYFYMGELIEFGRTRRIFERPTRPETESYVTGRLG